ncbi:MAG: 4-hydroxyphenylpyruvate dioxygenase [bacterium]|jgi:4-hydroxyphenylpyruvate dioxygenase|nr:4-hydroxyphenylpyruvate dioxygenase [Phycisphaerales bacterium]MCE2653276.1 4-hydroxyphenylpyruvate dioxygenase [Planctomycetaceae bacterium]
MSIAPQPPAAAKPSRIATTDPLQLIDVDHVRFYVGNAKQAAMYYAHCFGFCVEQVQDLTTGSRDSATYLLTQGNIRFLLTTGLTSEHAASHDVMLYGDGVKDVAFTVFDAEKAYEAALRNGGQSAQTPRTVSDAHGSVTTASIKTYGRCVHTFVSRSGGYDLTKVKEGGLFAPGFIKLPDLAINKHNREHPCGLKYVDHLVGNVELGKMNHWVRFYENVLEFKMFKHFDDKDISTEYSALMSKVMASGNNLIKMPINEPAEGKKKSQIEEYLDWHAHTPGVQHLALRTDDELHSIAELRRRNVEFLTLPDAYYELVWERVNKMLTTHGHQPVREDHEAVKKLGILVDADDEGYLLQLFTRPLQDRPTLFFEIICRRGSQSFGKGNFKALFEALELEQGRRGNL